MVSLKSHVEGERKTSSEHEEHKGANFLDLLLL